MYNGIGLATPRGSSTSGYVQRNLAYVKPYFKGKADFAKELKRLRVNPSYASFINYYSK